MIEQQISLLEWFLKDHVTLKTEAMMPENSAFIIQKSYFKKDAYESAVFLSNISWNQVIDFSKTFVKLLRKFIPTNITIYSIKIWCWKFSFVITLINDVLK